MNTSVTDILNLHTVTIRTKRTNIFGYLVELEPWTKLELVVFVAVSMIFPVY